MDVSESSIARASQDSLYHDVDEKVVSISAIPTSDEISQIPASVASMYPGMLSVESVKRLGHDVR